MTSAHICLCLDHFISGMCLFNWMNIAVYKKQIMNILNKNHSAIAYYMYSTSSIIRLSEQRNHGFFRGFESFQLSESSII